MNDVLESFSAIAPYIALLSDIRVTTDDSQYTTFMDGVSA